jgi:opacity protein-like surface antigen
MRLMVTTLAALVLCLFLATEAGAQARVPDYGMSAVGGDIGFFLPSDDELEAGLTLAGNYEYYFTPRLSLRATFGWTNPESEFEPDTDFVQRRLMFGVIYNWEHGKWHPFAGGGLGFYWLNVRENGVDFLDGETRFGFHGGGGIEYFTARTVSLKGEVQLHAIDDDDLFFSPSGVALLFGVKKYF